MTRPPRRKPAEHPRPVSYRSFAEQTEFGACENADCSRTARTTCTVCNGQFCLWHETHPGHRDESAARAARKS